MEDKSGTTFRFKEDLPTVCIVCGAPATGRSLQQVALPIDAKSKQMPLIQILGALFGFLFFWWLTDSNSPKNQWVSLPYCKNMIL